MTAPLQHSDKWLVPILRRVRWGDYERPDGTDGHGVANAQEIGELIEVELKKREDAARVDELNMACNHWWSCTGDTCEFKIGKGTCGYDDHRRAQLHKKHPKGRE